MQVVVVADHAHINGGQAKVSIESAIGLAGRGHEVTYFAAVGPVVVGDVIEMHIDGLPNLSVKIVQG